MAEYFFTNLLDAKNILHTLGDLFPGVITICDPDRKVIWANKAFTDLTGYTMEEMKDKTVGEVLQGPDTDDETIQYMKGKIKAEEAFECNILNYRKDKSTYWSHLSAVPVVIDGTLKYWIGTKYRTDFQLEKIMEEQAVLRETIQNLKDAIAKMV